MTYRTTNLCYAMLVMLAALYGCASLQTDQSAIGQRLNQAQVVETSAKRLASTLVKADTITADDAQRVLDAARVVAAAVDAGRAYLAAGNASGAEGQLAGASAALASLATFYIAHQGAKP